MKSLLSARHTGYFGDIGCISRKGQFPFRVFNLRGGGRKTRLIFMYDFKLPRNEGLDDCVFSGQWDNVMVKAEDVFEREESGWNLVIQGGGGWA